MHLHFLFFTHIFRYAWKTQMILKTNAVQNTDQVKQLYVRNVFGEYVVMSVIWNI